MSSVGSWNRPAAMRRNGGRCESLVVDFMACACKGLRAHIIIVLLVPNQKQDLVFFVAPDTSITVYLAAEGLGHSEHVSGTQAFLATMFVDLVRNVGDANNLISRDCRRGVYHFESEKSP